MSFLGRGRSPVTPRALTWRELARLKRGTVLIDFCWSTGEKEPVTLLDTFDSPFYTERRGLRNRPAHRIKLRYKKNGAIETYDAPDVGAEPYSHGVWNDSNALVLPQHANTLPTGPYRR